MKFIKHFILKKEREITNHSDIAINIFNKEWDAFLKKDGYLIHNDKINYLQLIKNGNEVTKVPWYFFWNSKLKLNIEFDFEKLKEYQEIISIYNQNFVLNN